MLAKDPQLPTPPSFSPRHGPPSPFSHWFSHQEKTEMIDIIWCYRVLWSKCLSVFISTSSPGDTTTEMLLHQCPGCIDSSWCLRESGASIPNSEAWRVCPSWLYCHGLINITQQQLSNVLWRSSKEEVFSVTFQKLCNSMKRCPIYIPPSNRGCA